MHYVNWYVSVRNTLIPSKSVNSDAPPLSILKYIDITHVFDASSFRHSRSILSTTVDDDIELVTFMNKDR